MGIYLRNMEMPKNCAECERWSICKCLKEYEDYESILYAVDDGDLVRADDCPLVEVKAPHGRLIDADEIEMPCLETTADQKEMEIAIKSTPTVIEPEGREE